MASRAADQDLLLDRDLTLTYPAILRLKMLQKSKLVFIS